MRVVTPKGTILLGLVLAAALVLRLNNIGFGLPAMYDPDEPFFVLKAFKLLDGRTLNPGWFGHPGTTTLYLLALIDVAVAGLGLASGRYASLKAFAQAVYAQPGLIFIPSRIAMSLIGVGTVLLTYMIARRLFGRRVALLAAALLAVNALHIAWSQVIRTDVQSSLFMLASLLFSIRAAEAPRARDFTLAGLFAGFAIATKWPAGLILVAAAGSALLQSGRDGGRRAATRSLALVAASTLLGLFLASPYIFLAWRTVVADVGGEVATGHLAHSGHGFVGNLRWYLQDQVAFTMGWAGLALALAGTGQLLRFRIARATLFPVTIGYLILISAQQQVWSRWVVPILPLLCIAAALAALSVAQWLADRAAPARWRPALAVVAALLLLVPSLIGAAAGATDRANDTRALASAWARSNIPPGSTVVVEQLALDLRPMPWKILFPIGAAGCVDGRHTLTGGVKFEQVQKARRGSAIVDLGNVPPEALASCRGDYAILTYYDLYRAERQRFPDQLANYDRLIAGGRTVALFRARPGVAGWPTTRIVALGSQVHGKPGFGG